MIRINYILVFLLGLAVFMQSCQEETYTLGELKTPTNLDITYEIVGQDAENPYGDGSGLVHFTASADNEFTFNFQFGDDSKIAIAQDGKATHKYTINGVNEYNVLVKAVGAGGVISTKTVQLEVFSSFTDPQAVEFLTGGSSKTWYWAADQFAHLGIGPNFLVDYGNNAHTHPFDWWAAPAWDKAGTCLYDGSFVFALDGKQVTFEHINPTGKAFFQGDNLGIIGAAEEGCYEYDFTGVKSVSFAPANSIATIDGEYWGTSMTFSDGGFMGWYVGSSTYEIIDVSANTLKVRVESAGQPEHAWYHTFTTEKPVQ
jgi:hypothetical protein